MSSMYPDIQEIKQVSDGAVIVWIFRYNGEEVRITYCENSHKWYCEALHEDYERTDMTSHYGDFMNFAYYSLKSNFANIPDYLLSPSLRHRKTKQSQINYYPSAFARRHVKALHKLINKPLTKAELKKFLALAVELGDNACMNSGNSDD